MHFMKPQLHVGFVVMNGYPVACDPRAGTFGGMETRAWQLARAMAQQGNVKVSMFVDDFCQSKRLYPLGVNGPEIVAIQSWIKRVRRRVQPAIKRTAKFPWYTIRNAKVSLLWELPVYAFDKYWRTWKTRNRTQGTKGLPSIPGHEPQLVQEPIDVYCTFGVNIISASVVATAKQAGRYSVLLIASDDDLNPAYRANARGLNRYNAPLNLCHYCVAHADAVVVQTPRQLDLLRTHFGREGTIITNPVDFDLWLPSDQVRNPALAVVDTLDRYALWIGRADNFHKRADLFLQVVKRCPEIPFVMIMNRQTPAIWDQIHAERPDNLHIIESVPFQEMGKAFAKAAVFVNTSSPQFEGFPNTFLQAAGLGIPIASLEVDPAGFVTKNNCGIVGSGAVQHFAATLHQLWQDPAMATQMGQNGYTYVQQHHNIQDKIAQLHAVIRTVL
jgi:glycosyltransferase involved in cell wall biosynthesis